MWFHLDQEITSFLRRDRLFRPGGRVCGIDSCFRWQQSSLSDLGWSASAQPTSFISQPKSAAIYRVVLKGAIMIVPRECIFDTIRRNLLLTITNFSYQMKSLERNQGFLAFGFSTYLSCSEVRPSTMKRCHYSKLFAHFPFCCIWSPMHFSHCVEFVSSSPLCAAESKTRVLRTTFVRMSKGKIYTWDAHVNFCRVHSRLTSLQGALYFICFLLSSLHQLSKPLLSVLLPFTHCQD